MAWVIVGNRVKHHGKFYEAGEKFQVDDEDLPAMLEDGAEEIPPARGRPKGRTREDKPLEWDEV